MFTKRRLTILSIVLLVVLYYVVTDPDLGILTDLPFGVGLLIVLRIFIISTLGIVLIETIPDLFTDHIIGDEKDLVTRSIVTPQGASMVFMAKSVRILAYAIVVGATILGYTMS